MDLKNTRFGQKISRNYNDAKDKLGHAKVNDKLRDKVATQDAKLAGRKAERQELKVRKDLGVSQKDFANIKRSMPKQAQNSADLLHHYEGFQAKDAKHSQRLFDRAMSGADNQDRSRPFMSFHSLLDQAVVYRLENDRATDTDMHVHLLDHTFARIDNTPKMNAAQKHAAKSLAFGLISQMSYDAGTEAILQKPRTKNFAALSAAQHGKRNTAERYMDRRAVKTTVAAAFVTNAVSKAGTQVKRAATRAVKNTFNASTSVLAGTATGTKAAALPLTGVARYATAVAKGVKDASVDQGRQLRKQFENKPR